MNKEVFKRLDRMRNYSISFHRLYSDYVKGLGEKLDKHGYLFVRGVSSWSDRYELDPKVVAFAVEEFDFTGTDMDRNVMGIETILGEIVTADDIVVSEGGGCGEPDGFPGDNPFAYLSLNLQTKQGLSQLPHRMFRFVDDDPGHADAKEEMGRAGVSYPDTFLEQRERERIIPKLDQAIKDAKPNGRVYLLLSFPHLLDGTAQQFRKRMPIFDYLESMGADGGHMMTEDGKLVDRIPYVLAAPATVWTAYWGDIRPLPKDKWDAILSFTTSHD